MLDLYKLSNLLGGKVASAINYAVFVSTMLSFVARAKSSGLTADTKYHTLVFVMGRLGLFSLLTVLFMFGTPGIFAQTVDGILPPSIVPPLPLSTRVLVNTISTATAFPSQIDDGGSVSISLTSDPAPQQHPQHTVKHARLYVVFHAGGDQETYEQGQAAWSAQITGRFVGVKADLTEDVLIPDVSLTIDELRPEATYVVSSIDVALHHPFHANSSSSKYVTIRFELDDPDGWLPSSVSAVNDAIRLSLRLDEQVVYNFASTTAPDDYTVYTSIMGSSPLESSCSSTDGSSDWIEGTEVTLTWNLPAIVAASSFEAFEVEIVRLYNVDRAVMQAPTFIRTKIDWQSAQRIRVGGSERSLRVTPIDGSGYYAFRVRAISRIANARSGETRLVIGPWSDAPVQGTQHDFEPCVNTYSYSGMSPEEYEHDAVFYFLDANRHRVWRHSTVVANDTTSNSVTSESRSYLSQLGALTQMLIRDNAVDGVIGQQLLHDRSGRSSLVTTPAPIRVEDVYVSSLAFVNDGLRNGSGDPYSRLDFDVLGSTYSAPTSVDDASPLSAHHSSLNANLSDPSAGGLPFLRHHYKADGSLLATVLPGGARRPTGSGVSPIDKSTRHLRSNVSYLELYQIFGSETPNEGDITKFIEVSPDDVASARYVNGQGQLIATCLIGGTELATSQEATEWEAGGTYIIADGTASPLLNLNGKHSSAVRNQQERVNVSTLAHDVKGGTKVAPNERLASTAFALVTPTTVSVSYYGLLADLEPSPSHALVLDDCLTASFQCSAKVEYRIVRTDVVPCSVIVDWRSVTNAITTPETYELGFGEYLIARRIVSPQENAGNQLPMDAVLGSHFQASELTAAVESLIVDAFDESDPDLSDDERLAHYRNFRQSYSATEFKVSVPHPQPEPPAEVPCPLVNLPAPKDCNACPPEALRGEFDTPRFAEYALSAYENAGLPGPVTLNSVLFYMVGTTKTDKFDYTPVVSHSADLNALVKNLLTEVDDDQFLYDCKGMWALWTTLVDARIEVLKGAHASNTFANPVFAGENSDLIELFIRILGKQYAAAPLVRDLTFYNGNEVAEAYKYIRTTASTTKINQCTTQFTSGGITNWFGVEACLSSEVSTADLNRLKQATRTSFGNLEVPAEAERLKKEVFRDLSDKCTARCTTLTDALIQQLVEQQHAMTEFQRYCYIRSATEDCVNYCTLSNEPTEADLTAFRKRLTGAPIVEITETCDSSATRISHTGSYLDMLIDFLNDDYERRRASAEFPICVNYAVVAYNFLKSAGLSNPQIPACIRDAALGQNQLPLAELASEEDCAAFEQSGTNRYFIRVFKPHRGRFYRGGTDSCPACDFHFEGYSKNPLATHPWVDALNNYMDATWGAALSDRHEDANTAHLLDSGEVRPILSYTSRSPEFVALAPGRYKIDVDDSLRGLIDNLRQTLMDSSVGINGAAVPIFTMNYGATGGGTLVTSPAIGWREALQRAHGSVVAYDGNALRFAGPVDSAGSPLNPNDSIWRMYGPLGIHFRGPNDESLTGELGPLFLWNIVPVTDDSGRIQSLTLQTIVNNVETQSEFSAAAVVESPPSFLDSLFTASFGYFFVDDNQVLAFKDLVNNVSIPINGISFFRRRSRVLLGAGTCPATNLCSLTTSCNICIEWQEPAPELTEGAPNRGPLDCAGIEIRRIKAEIRAQFRRKLDEYYTRLALEIEQKCDVDNINVGLLRLSYPQKFYHYTLYYYDRAGRLIRTVSPRGVSISNSNNYQQMPGHSFVSRFHHDNMGRVTSKAAPDGGVTRYFYDKLGRLRFVQDERQASASTKRLSYVKYDARSRATESGEVEYTGTLATLVASEVDNSAWPSGALARRDVVMYHYDQKVTSTTADAGWVTVSNETGLTQRNVRNRLSWSLAVPVLGSGASIATTPNVVRTFYSYDPHGNVVAEVYDIPKDANVNSDRIVKRLDYVWDLSTGNITTVDYQTQVVGENQPKTDRFQHRYTYDKNARLKYVETSRNGVIWERDAAYDYDRLGTLRRVTIGEDSVQGIDYTYTLLGDLKAINHPSLDPANDAGQDGTGTGANRNVAKDAFALGFSYHDGDFEKTVGSTESPFNTNNTSFLKHEGTGLWSGFIGATTLHLAEITVPSGSTLMRNGALMGERLKYDRIGRLRVVTTFENVGNTWTSDATSGWSSSYMYDQNSNLTRVKRSEALSATPGLYDDVTIAPKNLSGNNSNVIDVVTDAGTNAVAGFTDLRTQTTTQNAVDVTGRVTTESNSGLARTNTWTSTDALSTATAGTTEARYLYDAAGNVVRVIVDNAGTDSTIYRIPSGGIADVATYKRVGNGNVVPMEWTIIGNGVIGVSRDVEDPETGPTFHRRVGTKLYALADHLGSVRAVVGDVKIPASGGTFTADVMSVYDYEAYGVPRPGLSLDVRAYWRYGFQGMLKQSELLGSTTDVSDYLTPFRSYDARSGRWRSHDPIFQPWESTYLGMGGNPAMMVDPWGLNDEPLSNPLTPPSKFRPFSSQMYTGPPVPVNSTIGQQVNDHHTSTGGEWPATATFERDGIHYGAAVDKDGRGVFYVATAAGEKDAPAMMISPKLAKEIHDNEVAARQFANGYGMLRVGSDFHWMAYPGKASEGLASDWRRALLNPFWWAGTIGASVSVVRSGPPRPASSTAQQTTPTTTGAKPSTVAATSTVAPSTGAAGKGATGEVAGVAGKGASDVSTSLVRTGVEVSEHAARRMAERGISQKMIETALSKGTKYYDPKNQTFNYVLKNGFASGQDLLVGTSTVTERIATVLRGHKLIKSRFVRQ